MLIPKVIVRGSTEERRHSALFESTAAFLDCCSARGYNTTTYATERTENIVYADLGIIARGEIKAHYVLAALFTKKNAVYYRLYCIEDKSAMYLSPHTYMGRPSYVYGMGIIFGNICTHLGQHMDFALQDQLSFYDDTISLAVIQATSIYLPEFDVKKEKDLLQPCSFCGQERMYTNVSMALLRDVWGQEKERRYYGFCVSCYLRDEMSICISIGDFFDQEYVAKGENVWNRFFEESLSGVELVIVSCPSMHNVHDKIKGWYTGGNR